VNVHTHDDGKWCKWGEIHPQQEQDERKIRDLLLLYLFSSSKCNNQSVTPHVTPYSHLMKQDDM
jgi:hypothetical protein